MDKKQLFAEMIAMARAAPLHNMSHAETCAKVIQEFAGFADQYIKEQEANEAGQALSAE